MHLAVLVVKHLQIPEGLKIKRKESKLKLKVRKALISLKTILTPKTRLETSESMINTDTVTEQGKDSVCLVFVLLPVRELLIFPFDASFEYGALKFARLPSVSHRLLTKAIIIALKDFL